jgi:hypothetical protein
MRLLPILAAGSLLALAACGNSSMRASSPATPPPSALTAPQNATPQGGLRGGGEGGSGNGGQNAGAAGGQR